MRLLHVVSSLVVLLPAITTSQIPGSPKGYSIVGAWHFEETSASLVLDSSPYSHAAQVYGTSIVPGVAGTARQFSGQGEYILIPNGSSGAFDFRDSVSFTIDLWIKTVQSGVGMILRRGIAPVPGFLITVENGKIRATIGNREDSVAPDTLLHVVSVATYNDGLWHRIRVVRDRALQQLHLYVDGQPAASPVRDPVRFDLVSDRPLTMGRWENSWYPTFFSGTIDEVYLVRGAFHRDSSFTPQIAVQPWALEFGRGDFPVDSTRNLTILNVDLSRSLAVDSVRSSTAAFSVPPTAAILPPESSLTVAVRYAPLTPGKHSGTISVFSSDALNPVITIPLHGEAWAPLPAAQIMSVEDVPGDYGRNVRVVWYRSVFDDNSSGTPATAYSLWKRARTREPGGSLPGSISATESLLETTAGAWEFVTQVPAARFTEYTCSASTDGDYAGTTIPWTVFAVATHLADNEVIVSEPDSGYSVYGPWTTALMGDAPAVIPASIRLHQNYPNPFNPSTMIRYELPASMHVRLGIYDLLGREIFLLADREMEAGIHEIRFNASGLSSGVYLCRLQAGNSAETRKLVVVR